MTISIPWQLSARPKKLERNGYLKASVQVVLGGASLKADEQWLVASIRSFKIWCAISAIFSLRLKETMLNGHYRPLVTWKLSKKKFGIIWFHQYHKSEMCLSTWSITIFQKQNVWALEHTQHHILHTYKGWQGADGCRGWKLRSRQRLR